MRVRDDAVGRDHEPRTSCALPAGERHPRDARDGCCSRRQDGIVECDGRSGGLDVEFEQSTKLWEPVVKHSGAHLSETFGNGARRDRIDRSEHLGGSEGGRQHGGAGGGDARPYEAERQRTGEHSKRTAEHPIDDAEVRAIDPPAQCRAHRADCGCTAGHQQDHERDHGNHPSVLPRPPVVHDRHEPPRRDTAEHNADEYAEARHEAALDAEEEGDQKQCDQHDVEDLHAHRRSVVESARGWGLRSISVGAQADQPP